jgi:nucleoid-associated protein YgaU
MVFKGSRYSKTEVVTPENSRGRRPRVLAMRIVPDAPGVVLHTVTDGERLDQIAQRYYNDAKKYWLILDANPEVLHPLDVLRTGQRIRIPRNRVI